MDYIAQPFTNGTITLYKHQLNSIKTMEDLEENRAIVVSDSITVHTRVGILCDVAGFGKSYSVIGMIKRSKGKYGYIDDDIISTAAGGLIRREETERKEVSNCNLILVGKATLNQWIDKLKLTDLKWKCVRTREEAENTNSDEYDIILVTEKNYNYVIQCNYWITWKRFIYDDPCSYRVKAMKTPSAGFVWFLTSEPSKIFLKHFKNSTGYMKDVILKNIDDYLEFEKVYRCLFVKNTKDILRVSYSLPEVKSHEYVCHVRLYSIIRQLLPEEVKKAIRAGDAWHAMHLLRGNESTEKNATLKTIIKQKKIEEVKDRYTEDQLKTLLKEIDTRFDNMLNEMCPVCFMSLTDPVIEMNCQQMFCESCLDKSMGKCPNCRVDFKPSSVVRVSTTETTEEETEELHRPRLTKEQTIISIITSVSGGKFIIYSTFENSFTLIRKVLEENKIKYVEFNDRGAVYRKVNQIKKSEIEVVFLTDYATTNGVDMLDVTDIIFYHDVEINDLNAVVSKANRIGRESTLNIHRLKADI